MNILMIAGFLGRDVETKQTKNGVKITTLAVADNVTKDEVIWWRCTIFGNTCEKILPHLKKGSSVIIHGKQKKPKIFDRKDGTQDVSCEMIVSSIDFLPGNKSDKNEQDQGQPKQQPPQQQPQQQYQAGQAQYTVGQQDQQPQQQDPQYEGQDGLPF